MDSDMFRDVLSPSEIDTLLRGVGAEPIVPHKRVLSAKDITDIINNYAGDVLKLVLGNCNAKEVIGTLTSIMLEVELATLIRGNEVSS
jgi:hypothetical protein